MPIESDFCRLLVIKKGQADGWHPQSGRLATRISNVAAGDAKPGRVNVSLAALANSGENRAG